MKTTHPILAGALVAVLLLFGGCGDDDDSSGTDETTDDTAETDAAPAAGDAAAGSEVYGDTCAACHGPDAEGVDGLGKALAPSEFVATSSADELVAFVKVGRPSSDPENTTGVDMPPKGGNPALTDEDIANVVAYTQSLN
jgi:disulfide bond formation protein DsbB